MDEFEIVSNLYCNGHNISDISKIKSYYRLTIKDFGIMLYDFDYQNTDEPLFFRTILKYEISYNTIVIIL